MRNLLMKKLFTVVCCMFFVCACTNPLIQQYGRQKDQQGLVSSMQESYRLQKKYDLLEKNLLEEYEERIKDKHKIGELFSVLDLADFYTYGLVNYKKSLEYYLKADELNQKIKQSGITRDAEKVRDPSSSGFDYIDKAIIYYKNDGDSSVPRTYNFDEISQNIKNARIRIKKILTGYAVEDADKNKYYPKIEILDTNNYAYIIRVEKDVFDPKIFDAFEQELSGKTEEYFKRRHKISKDEKIYYINYNIVRCLFDTFDIFTLSASQSNKIMAYIDNTLAHNPFDEVNLQKAYLKFTKVLCLSKLERHEESIKYFNDFEGDIKSINKRLIEDMKYLKNARNKEILTSTAKAALLLTLDVISIGRAAASGGTVNSLQSFGIIQDIVGNILPLLREIKIAGESEYASGFNVLLNIDEQLKLFRGIGISHHTNRNTKESIFYHKESINIINNLRSTISSEKGRINFAQYKETVYNTLVDDLIANKSDEEALFYAESSRSRALVDLLGSRKDIIFKNEKTNEYVNDIVDAQIYQDSIRQQAGVSDEQAEYINKLRSSTIERGVGGTTKNPNQNEEELLNSQEMLSMITVSDLKIPEIQALLPEHSSIIEYYISDNRIYAWLIEKTNIKSYILNIHPEQLKQEIESFNQLITTSKSNLQDIYKSGKNLYEQLFAFIEKDIKNKQLYIVGHRYLHFLPFEALYDGTQFFVQRYSLSYLPSSSVLKFLKPSNGRFQSLLAIGNPKVDYIQNVSPLVGAEQEAISVAGIFPLQEVYLKQDATETVFRKKAKDYNIFHIASHGIFEPDDPLDSKLFLTQDNKNDGMLTARELYGIQMDASLVVLSACETALSDIKNGDELIGLVRGFFFAGTSSLIASLWKVHDIATEKLMILFYKKLKSEGKLVTSALQEAKIGMINSKQYEHPFFWAPFNLYGIGL